MTRRPFALLLAASLAACGGSETPRDESARSVGPMIEIADVGFATPESVLHDQAEDVYLVSNVNGAPSDKDGNGFISRLTPAGEVERLKWIDGTAEGTTLNAPKGMAILGDTLYVADIDCVRRFVRTTGAAAGEICFEGATFLNDVAVDRDHQLYVTDSGLDAQFAPTGTDAIWRFSPDGQKTRFQQGSELGNPNGIAFGDSSALVVTFGSGEIYRITTNGERQTMLPGAEGRALDGIVFTSDGGFVFSSWGDSAVHRVEPDGRTSKVLRDVESPADIGYDVTRNRVLVPLFAPDRVILKDLMERGAEGG